MPVSGKLLKAINKEMQAIPIDDERWSELAVELNQLRLAAESALAVHQRRTEEKGVQAVQRLLIPFFAMSNPQEGDQAGARRSADIETIFRA